MTIEEITKSKEVVNFFIKDLMLIQTICGKGMTCYRCPFDTKDDGCALKTPPMNWKLDELYKSLKESKT